jgi:hypothetical protein
MHPGTTRSQGVILPQHQRLGEEIPEQDLPALSVHNFEKLETWAGQYVDKTGKLKPGFFIRYLGNWYLDPNGAHWFSTLQPLSKELSDNVQRSFERKTRATNIEEIPVEDAVDVIAEETVSPVVPPADVAIMEEAG